MIIIEDKGNKEGQHKLKHYYFQRNGIKLIRQPLPVGDYIVSNEKIMDVIVRKEKRNLEAKKMDFIGSYSVSVDTKKDMQEIIGNICGKSHPRFRDECILAQNNGIKLYVLIENEDGIKSVNDVFKWYNPRMNRYKKIQSAHAAGKMAKVPLPKAPPTTGPVLAKSMLTMEKKYGVEFRFCHPLKAGEEVVKLLTQESED